MALDATGDTLASSMKSSFLTMKQVKRRLPAAWHKMILGCSTIKTIVSKWFHIPLGPRLSLPFLFLPRVNPLAPHRPHRCRQQGLPRWHWQPKGQPSCDPAGAKSSYLRSFGGSHENNQIIILSRITIYNIFKKMLQNFKKNDSLLLCAVWVFDRWVVLLLANFWSILM